MKIVREKNAVSYILSGELDNYHIQQIKELCRYDIDLTHPKLVRLNFKNVTFVDSTGLGFVLARYKQVKAYGGELRLVDVPDNVRKIFNLSGVFSIIKTENPSMVNGL